MVFKNIILLAILIIILGISVYIGMTYESSPLSNILWHSYETLPGSRLSSTLQGEIESFKEGGPVVNDETVCTSYNNGGRCSSVMRGGGKDMFVQGDGNMVIYENGRAKWASNTSRGNGEYKMVMQGDGNLVLYKRDRGRDVPIWASNTNGRGQGPFAAVMNKDGNLAIYDWNTNITWSSTQNIWN